VERKGRIDHAPRRRASMDLRRVHPGPSLGQFSATSAREVRGVRSLPAASRRGSRKSSV
jgi:hypothetical protein